MTDVETMDPMVPAKGTKDNGTKKSSWRSLVAYWILGLCNNYGYVVMLSAANDILHKGSETEEGSTLSENAKARDCNYMSTGAILLADIIPCLIIKMIAPFLPFFVHVRVAVCVISAAAGLLLVAFSETEQWLAITGIIITSFATGLGEASFLQYSSFYNKDVVSTWSSGTGGAGIAGALSYTILQKLGLQTALLLMLLVPLMMAISFWIILPSPDEKMVMDVLKQINEQEVSDPMVAFKKKLRLVPGLMKFMIPIGLVYLFEYFINQGTFELVNFEGFFLDHRAQYRWLQVDYQIGVFVSRSSVNLVHIQKIWIFAALQALNVVIFTTEVIYYYLPTFWIVLALTFWEGLLGGGAYVNTFYKISSEVPDEDKQFSMAATGFADSIGITLAGIFAMLVHNDICDLPKPNRTSW